VTDPTPGSQGVQKSGKASGIMSSYFFFVRHKKSVVRFQKNNEKDMLPFASGSKIQELAADQV
jgi:hypothetical protein